MIHEIRFKLTDAELEKAKEGVWRSMIYGTVHEKILIALRDYQPPIPALQVGDELVHGGIVLYADSGGCYVQYRETRSCIHAKHFPTGMKVFRDGVGVLAPWPEVTG